MKNRCPLLLAGAAAWGFCAIAAAQTSVYSVYQDNFDAGTLAGCIQWSFREVHSGSPVLLSTTPAPPSPAPTRFLGEFGGCDAARLGPFREGTASVRLQFDV